MMSYSESFLQAIETFLEETGVDPTTLGKQALGDPSFVFDLRRGRSPSAKTMDRVHEWMAAKREAA